MPAVVDGVLWRVESLLDDPGMRTFTASEMQQSAEGLASVVRATADARRLLGRAVESLGLSARGARRTLKVARTIADLAGDEETGLTAMAEALSYRGNTVDLHLRV